MDEIQRGGWVWASHLLLQLLVLIILMLKRLRILIFIICFSSDTLLYGFPHDITVNQLPCRGAFLSDEAVTTAGVSITAVLVLTALGVLYTRWCFREDFPAAEAPTIEMYV